MSGSTELEEAHVEIERDGKPVVVAFQGRHLGRVAYVCDGQKTVCRAYTTPKGKIAIAKRSVVAWRASAHPNKETWTGITNSDERWQPTYAPSVVDTWEELRMQLDTKTVAKLQGKAEPIPVERLGL